jgi:transcriptional accessory protein Tex/SPT6
MGLDPGIRTGVKVAVVDATGKLVDTATCYPHEPRATGTARFTPGPSCVKSMA